MVLLRDLFFSNVVSLSSIMFLGALVQQGCSEGICLCGGPPGYIRDPGEGRSYSRFGPWSLGKSE